MAVVGAAVAVLAHGAAELGERHQDHVLHAVAEVALERGQGLAELAQARRELALHAALGGVVVPAADLGERQLDARRRP